MKWFSRWFVHLFSKPEPEFSEEEWLKFTNYTAWFEQEVAKGDKSIEVIPPWEYAPDMPPYWGGWRQGNAEGWMSYSWRPYWAKLSDEEKAAYLEKWGMPEEWEYWIRMIAKKE